MLKRKFCVASFRFLTIIILFVFVFFFFYTYELALKALVSGICKNFNFFPLKSESNLHFHIRFCEEADAGCLTLRP